MDWNVTVPGYERGAYFAARSVSLESFMGEANMVASQDKLGGVGSPFVQERCCYGTLYLNGARPPMRYGCLRDCNDFKAI